MSEISSVFHSQVILHLMVLKERVHSELKISTIMRFNLLFMPIVLIFFQPLSLASRKGYGKMMQVRRPDAGPDVLMQVHRWCDAGPRICIF